MLAGPFSPNRNFTPVPPSEVSQSGPYASNPGPVAPLNPYHRHISDAKLVAQLTSRTRSCFYYSLSFFSTSSCIHASLSLKNSNFRLLSEASHIVRVSTLSRCTEILQSRVHLNFISFTNHDYHSPTFESGLLIEELGSTFFVLTATCSALLLNAPSVTPNRLAFHGTQPSASRSSMRRVRRSSTFPPNIDSIIEALELRSIRVLKTFLRSTYFPAPNNRCKKLVVNFGFVALQSASRWLRAFAKSDEVSIGFPSASFPDALSRSSSMRGTAILDWSGSKCVSSPTITQNLQSLEDDHDTPEMTHGLTIHHARSHYACPTPSNQSYLYYSLSSRTQRRSSGGRSRR